MPDSEHAISDGVIAPGGFTADHYYLWEDQTFHIIAGPREARIGDQVVSVGAGDTVHSLRGVSLYMKDTGDSEARLIRYIFPGDWAEDFMAETSRQSHGGKHGFELIQPKRWFQACVSVCT
ncbi:MAG: hypothetical protein WBO55_08185 [Rhizobiaceae bacterium]